MRRQQRRKPSVAILGAGAMGRAVAYDLARSGHPLLILDANDRAAKEIARRYARGRATVTAVDAGDPDSLPRALAPAALVIHCAPYALNLAVMRAALAAGCHYIDLGGLFHTTRKQLRLDSAFRRAGLLAVLGMGSAPGTTNVLASAAAARLRRVRAVRVYNGGADFTRYESPLPFAFSPATVLDEFTLPPVVFRGGRFHEEEPLSGEEEFPFVLGPQEVHLSLHSEVATLPTSFRHLGIRECAFKIAYDPTFTERLTFLVELGLADRKKGPLGVAPREVLLDSFRRLPPPPERVDDRDTLVVIVEGEDAKGPLSVRYDLTAGPQPRPPLSAVARNTGLPAAIVARMILGNVIRRRGVLPPEQCVPVRPFLAALAERGLQARVSLTRPNVTPSLARSPRRP